MKRWFAIGLSCFAAVCAHGEEVRRQEMYSPASIESFFDGAIGTQIAVGNSVGATVALVQDGVVMFAKGYGLANRDTNVPVDAERTLFRIGSVSKLFVWVAVLQQHSAGRLDLYADVNDYLPDFAIPETFPLPITLRHLMTHTAGFEDRVIGLFASGPRTVGDFHENLIKMLPVRVMMPGKHAAYSNYGSALAAYIVENVAGEPWDDYLERHVFEPLRMRRTSSRQPLPKALAEDVASGYWLEQHEMVEAPFEFLSIPPAGSISATATDMAAFMIELLSSYDSAVLTADARAKLFEPGFAHDPRMNGVLHGPYEMSSHGQRIVGHGGDMVAFHSELRLYPEHRMGVFLSFNSERGAAALAAVTAAFDDRLFGAPARSVAPERGGDVDRFVGTYASLRVPEVGPARIMKLLSTVRVGANAEGHLIVRASDRQGRFIAVDDGLFRSVDGRHTIAFSAETPAQSLFGDDPMIDFERVDVWGEPRVQIAIVALCTGMLALMLVWPASTLRHRARDGVRGELMATLIAVANATLLAYFLIALGTEVSGPRDVLFGNVEHLERLLWLPVIAAGLALLQVVSTYQAWVRRYWWLSRRLHYTLATAAIVVLLFWSNYWQLAAVTVDF